MNNMTFVIFTYNEEKRIERFIKFLEMVLVAGNKSISKAERMEKKYA